MNYKIVHEIPGRIRFSLGSSSFTEKEANVLCYIFSEKSFVRDVRPYPLSCSLLICYQEGYRDEVVKMVASMEWNILQAFELPAGAVVPRHYSEQYVTQIVYMTARRLVVSLYFPAYLRTFFIAGRALPFIWKGIKQALTKNRLNVEVLDATAISVSIIRRDFSTAGMIIYLLSVGSLLEEWTHKKSRDDLAISLALRIDSVWVKRKGIEIRINSKDLSPGDLVVVRMGSSIPVDGKVVAGEAMVNQASMTGEGIPVRRVSGDTVYAGTVMEEGELVIRTTALGSETRLNKIIQLIDESETLKAAVQSKIENMADAIVPYNFLLAGAVYLFSRSMALASAALMVDYSCALKMSTPIAVLAAMREGTYHGFIIKGGKFLEETAEADTIVFDKTGTLTKAKPHVVDVIPFGGISRDEVLRLSACLEEHFPHSVASAVIAMAEEEGINHREMHAAVEYVVAHGIASYIDGKRAVIGSRHFVFEDEQVALSEEEKRIIEAKAEAHSLLFLALDGKLRGMICITDPVRPEAPGVVAQLKSLGINHVVMLTGDGEQAARAIAEAINADDYRFQVLPADKAEYIQDLRRQGRRVIMLGDGINDSPALSAANVGIAMKNGADIAREIADITFTEAELKAIIDLRRLSALLIKRISHNFRFTVGFNSALMALGIFGVIPPHTSALLHNLSTVAVCANSMQDLLEEPWAKSG